MYVVSGGLGTSKLIDAASMALAPMIPIINIMSVSVMEDRGGDGRNRINLLFKNIYKKSLGNSLCDRVWHLMC